jgi:hypothetical protein
MVFHNCGAPGRKLSMPNFSLKPCEQHPQMLLTPEFIANLPKCEQCLRVLRHMSRELDVEEYRRNHRTDLEQVDVADLTSAANTLKLALL